MPGVSSWNRNDRAARRRRPPPEPVVNLATLPVILKIDDMAAIYRMNTRTIRRQSNRIYLVRCRSKSTRFVGAVTT